MFKQAVKYVMTLSVLLLWGIGSHSFIQSRTYLPENAEVIENSISAGGKNYSDESIRKACASFIAGVSPRIAAGYNHSATDYGGFNGNHSAKSFAGSGTACKATSYYHLNGYSSRGLFATGRTADYYILTLRQLII